jgi:hypothetical protein
MNQKPTCYTLYWPGSLMAAVPDTFRYVIKITGNQIENCLFAVFELLYSKKNIWNGLGLKIAILYFLAL